MKIFFQEPEHFEIELSSRTLDLVAKAEKSKRIEC